MRRKGTGTGTWAEWRRAGAAAADARQQGVAAGRVRTLDLRAAPPGRCRRGRQDVAAGLVQFLDPRAAPPSTLLWPSALLPSPSALLRKSPLITASGPGSPYRVARASRAAVWPGGLPARGPPRWSAMVPDRERIRASPSQEQPPPGVPERRFEGRVHHDAVVRVGPCCGGRGRRPGCAGAGARRRGSSGSGAQSARPSSASIVGLGRRIDCVQRCQNGLHWHGDPPSEGLALRLGMPRA